jgi:uncharacterized membrane protein
LNALTDTTLGFLLLFVFVSLLMVGLAVPVIRRRVKPNYLYGFRTPKTLGDERIWYEANAYAGRLLLRLGIALTLAAIGLYFAIGANFVVYNVVFGLLTLSGLLIVTLLSFRYLRSL